MNSRMPHMLIQAPPPPPPPPASQPTTQAQAHGHSAHPQHSTAPLSHSHTTHTHIGNSNALVRTQPAPSNIHGQPYSHSQPTNMPQYSQQHQQQQQPQYQQHSQGQRHQAPPLQQHQHLHQHPQHQTQQQHQLQSHHQAPPPPAQQRQVRFTTHQPSKSIIHFEPQELSDLLLVVDDHDFYVHTQILARSSYYFRSVAIAPTPASGGPGTVPAKKRVVIDKIGVEGFEKVPGKYVHVFLKLLYSSDIKTNLRIAVTRGIDTLLSTDLAMQELRGRSAAHTSAFVTSDVASLTISYFLMLAKYFQVPTVLQLGEQWITRNVGTSHHIEDLLDWLVFTQTLSLHEAQRHIIEIIARNIDRTEGTQLMQYPQWDQLSAPVLKKLLFASHGYHLSTMSRLKKKAGWTG